VHECDRQTTDRPRYREMGKNRQNRLCCKTRFCPIIQLQLTIRAFKPLSKMVVPAGERSGVSESVNEFGSPLNSKHVHNDMYCFRYARRLQNHHWCP